jgi:hypothetical protein
LSKYNKSPILTTTSSSESGFDLKIKIPLEILNKNTS